METRLTLSNPVSIGGVCGVMLPSETLGVVMSKWILVAPLLLSMVHDSSLDM